MLYPINLNLQGRPCLVIGGGRVALRKVRSLLKADAKVIVVAPAVAEEIKDLAAEGQIVWLPKSAESSDVKDSFLVICATVDTTTNRDIAVAAKKTGALVNMAAPPLELSDFTIPASESCGDLLVTFATGGKSPELARKLKIRYGSEYAAFGEFLSIIEPYRRGLIQRLADSEACAAFWRETLDDEVMELVSQGRFDEAEERIADAFISIGVKS